MDLSDVLDSELGNHLSNRFVLLARQLLEQISPYVREMESNNPGRALTMLDEYLPAIANLFENFPRMPQPLYAILSELIKQMGKYFNARGLYPEQVRWAQALFDYFLNNEAETGVRIDLAILNTIASGFTMLGEHQDAVDLYEFILELYQDEPDHPGIAVITFNAALAYYQLGNVERALLLCRRAIELDRQLGDWRGEARSQFLLADVLDVLRDERGIFEALHQAVALAETHDSRFLQAQTLSKLAHYSARYIDWEQAEPLYSQAIAVWRSLGDEENLAAALFNYAVLLEETGRLAQALELAQESLRIYERDAIYLAERVRHAIAEWESQSP